MVVGHGDSQIWIDVAIVAPTSSCPRTLTSNAKKDGSAARTEEGVKGRRYGAGVTPFVLESGGRPGSCARSLLMKFASDNAPVGVEVGRAWQAISCIIQAETSLATLTAWGGSSALAGGRVAIRIP